jgi:hypothetical protein
MQQNGKIPRSIKPYTHNKQHAGTWGLFTYIIHCLTVLQTSYYTYFLQKDKQACGHWTKRQSKRYVPSLVALPRNSP